MFEDQTVLLWVTAVELPVMGALFWLIWHTRRDCETRFGEARRHAEIGLARMTEALAAHKLEVAKTYASIATLKDVEGRLTAHLLRIETKLDETRPCPREPKG
ncbi:hypothetical protein [Roseospira goensis]|uniref:Uncharacterized protein n=1 Tax=Roseospira goensis TaxID=391922 RepID=A0A7W6RXN4_9PROT|nr:hypothetical protein [Roseospira goensis]MBB4285126.1 hypothetical protein [Roseospira goensis]